MDNNALTLKYFIMFLFGVYLFWLVAVAAAKNPTSNDLKPQKSLSNEYKMRVSQANPDCESRILIQLYEFEERLAKTLTKHAAAIKPANELPEDAVELEERSYYFGTQKMNWFEAHRTCKLLGMELLSLESLKKATLIYNYFKENHKGLDHYWLGGTDLGREGRWTWSGTGKDFTFSAWGNKEPNNSGGNQNCAYVWSTVGTPANNWDDNNCNLPHYFVCELLE